MSATEENLADQSLPRGVLLGALLVEWAFALGQVVFGILLFGFAGGYFGTFVDLGLAWFREEWVGYGRTVGWTIAALAGAIGLPMGWAKINHRTLTFPSPRQVRQKLSKRKGQEEPAKEFRSLGEVAKAAGVLALVGGILGVFLGCLLIMSWFSLALSPFASAEWFQQIEWQSTRDFADRSLHRDSPGTVMTSSSPLMVHLVMWPSALLAGLGFAFGAIYGTWQYMDTRRRRAKR